MKNIFLIIEFDGSGYHGWQIQKNAMTVQEIVQKAICRLTNQNCQLIGASRTDEGVHALGMAANFMTESNIPPNKFAYAINTHLPGDIVIKESREVAMDFHARFCAQGKKYRYQIYNSQVPSALLQNRIYHVRKSLDISAMQVAARCFIGTHDFLAFCAAGSSVKTTVRTIFEMTVTKEDSVITFEVSGNGFLYNMVRIIAGTLIQVGKGEIEPLCIGDIIKSCDRKRAGITVPPQGLYLVAVYYENFPQKNTLR